MASRSADTRTGFFAHSSSSNPFVHLSLQATLQLASATGADIKYEPLDITIVGSNDFYTQSRSVRRELTLEHHFPMAQDGADGPSSCPATE